MQNGPVRAVPRRFVLGFLLAPVSSIARNGAVQWYRDDSCSDLTTFSVMPASPNFPGVTASSDPVSEPMHWSHVGLEVKPYRRTRRVRILQYARSIVNSMRWPHVGLDLTTLSVPSDAAGVSASCSKHDPIVHSAACVCVCVGPRVL